MGHRVRGKKEKRGNRKEKIVKKGKSRKHEGSKTRKRKLLFAQHHGMLEWWNIGF